MRTSLIAVLVLIQVLFGVNFPASKVIVKQMDPILWSNLRFFFAGIGMLFMTLAFRRKHPVINRHFLKQVFALSILGMALGQGLFLVGLKFTTATNSSIIITFIPILTLIIVILRKQETLTFHKLIGIIMAFMGVILMRDITQFNFSNNTFVGDLIVFSGAICFALYLSFGRKFFMTYDNMWATTWMFFISGLAMSLFNISKLPTLVSFDFNQTFILCALYSIIGATLLTYYLNNWALNRAPSGIVAVFIYLQPVVAVILGYLFLGEQITVRMVICGILIMTGLIFTLGKIRIG